MNAYLAMLRELVGKRREGELTKALTPPASWRDPDTGLPAGWTDEDEEWAQWERAFAAR